MGKFLFWAVVVVAVLFVTRLIAHHAARRQDAQKAAPPKGAISKPETMVRCAHCGVFIPRSDAVSESSGFWCSPAHAKAGHKEV